MATSKIKKDDTVILIAGKEKGKTGLVTKLEGNYAVVQGLNMVTHYVKRNQQQGTEGALKKIEAPIHVSNLAYYDDKEKKAVKIGFKILSDQTKIRYSKRTKKEVGK